MTWKPSEQKNLKFIEIRECNAVEYDNTRQKKEEIKRQVVARL